MLILFDLNAPVLTTQSPEYIFNAIQSRKNSSDVLHNKKSLIDSCP